MCKGIFRQHCRNVCSLDSWRRMIARTSLWTACHHTSKRHSRRPYSILISSYTACIRNILRGNKGVCYLTSRGIWSSYLDMKCYFSAQNYNIPTCFLLPHPDDFTSQWAMVGEFKFLSILLTYLQFKVFILKFFTIDWLPTSPILIGEISPLYHETLYDWKRSEIKIDWPHAHL